MAGAYARRFPRHRRSVCHESGVHEPHPVSLVVTDDLQPEQGDGLLPAPALHPAPDLVRALVDRGVPAPRSPAGSPSLATGHAPGWAPPLLLRLHPLLDPHLRLPLPRREPLPRVRRRGGPSTRSTCGCPAAPAPQSRWRAFFRLVLAIPALAVSSALSGAGVGFSGTTGKSSNTSATRAGDRGRHGRRVPRLVRLARDRPDAARAPGRRRLRPRLQGAAPRLRPARHRPLPERRPDGAARRRSTRPAPHPVHLVGDSEDLRRSRVTVFFRLPLAIPHLVWLVPLVDPRVPRRDRPVVRDAARRQAGGAAAPVPLGVGALRVPRLRVPDAGGEPVPGLHRALRQLPARPRAARAPGARAAGRRSSGSSSSSRRSSSTRRSRTALVARRGPDLVLRARHRPGARGAAQPLGLRAALRRRRSTPTSSCSPTSTRTRARSKVRARPTPGPPGLAALDAAA